MAIVFKTPKSALNTTSKAIQNLGGDCPPCPEVNLEAAELEYTQNGEYTVTPEQGVDGFSSIDVTVNIPSDVNNQNKTVDPSTSSQSVSADSGYSGLGTVTVNAVTSSIDNNISAGNIKKDVTILGVTGNYDPQPNLSNLNITPSTNSQEYNPAISGVDGYSLVRVNAVTAAIDSNIQAENILDGVTILGVSGSDRGYDAGFGEGESAGYSAGYSEGYAQGQSECPEPPEPPVLNPLSVTPTTSAQTIYPDSSIEDGFSDVSVAAVTAAIDANISAGNIKKNITILGVTGSYDPQPELQAKTVNPSTSQQTVSPDQGKDGLSSVTVNAVTNAIDANIQAGNIKNGVSILGVTGNVVEASFEPNKEFYGDVTGIYTITPQSGYNGFEEVQVTVEYNPIGSFWNPFEVSDNTMMADVYNKLDEGGYFDDRSALFGMEVESGSIDSETGYYIAEDANGNSFAIEPYFENPDYNPELSPEDQPDVPALIFPENFDLSGLNIQVEAGFDNVTVTENEPEDPMLEPTYTTEIALGTLCGINWNSDMESWPLYWNGGLSGGIETSTRNLHLSTNEPQAMSLSSNEPWEIELDQPQAQSQMNIRPLSKSGLRSAAPTLEISQMSGDAGVFTLDVLSTSDQATGFTVRGLNSGNEVYVEVNSLGDYFTIESLEDNNDITWTCYDQNHLLEYSDDSGATWSDTTFTEVNGRYEWTINVNEGDIIMFRGNNDAFATNNDYCGFNSTKTVDVYGNICSLLRKENFNTYSLIAPNVFTRFFSDQIVYNKRLMIVNASGLILPSGVITERSLAETFAGCRQMTEAPELPAKYVDQYGYTSTFENCYGLTSAPEISATTVKDNGCVGMFRNCWNLLNAPSVLPADYLGQNCYEQMFSGCRSLINTPELPATHLGYRCYWYMFKECTALETAPELPATTLAGECYGCMFDGCTSLETAPVLAAPVLVNNCYSEMFSNCSSLSEVTCLATDISASNCTYGWLFGVAASGTFYKDENMSSWASGTDGIPTGWTIEDYVEPSE